METDLVGRYVKYVKYLPGSSIPKNFVNSYLRIRDNFSIIGDGWYLEQGGILIKSDFINGDVELMAKDFNPNCKLEKYKIF